jgi:hypothetical protein
MDKDFVSSITKFMNHLGLTPTFIIRREYTDRGVRKNICIGVVVSRGTEIEYNQIHCYNFRNGEVYYSEGNEIKGVHDGILAYLGDDRNVDRYFEQISRSKAKEYFTKHMGS